ncbi:MAG: glycosyltransferase family 39 protein, partial [Alphaproteobacteria bacterium]|nr:glycosyltransferase family 39 protein [Alphaproteobacteria bacterium]
MDAEESRSGSEIDTLRMGLVSLLTLSAFLVLYIFRALDDNSLVSWQWAFAGIDIRPLFLALAVALAGSLVLSRVRLPARLRAAVLFAGSFLAAAALWPIPEVNVDAARYFVQAKSLELHGVGYFLQQWGREIPAWTDLPLVPFIYGLVLGVLGESRIAIQVAATSFFSGTVVLTYLIGRMLWNDRTGTFGAVLLLAMPYLLTQVPLMLVDVPTMFFLTFAVFTTIKAVRHGGGWLLLAATAIAIAALSKYTNWLMLSVVPVIFVAHLDRGAATVGRRAGVICLGTGLLVGAVVLWGGDVIAGQIGLLLSYQVPALGGWSESLISTFLFQTHPFVAAAALWSLYLAVKRRDLKFAVVAWLLVLVVAFEAPRIRYILMIFPMLALM